ncbi:MAG: transporter substrate-binding domain-containing protein, partial [bacterium]
NHGVKVTSGEHIEDAYKELENGNVEAVVFDSPVLLYYAAHDGKGKVDTVGQVFKKEAYGIVFPPASRFRRPINESLLHLRENGTYDTIYNKWFSPVDNPQ